MNVDRYLLICDWLKRRYTSAAGVLVVSVGGIESRYKRLERLAWQKYIVAGDDTLAGMFFPPDRFVWNE